MVLNEMISNSILPMKRLAIDIVFVGTVLNQHDINCGGIYGNDIRLKLDLNRMSSINVTSINVLSIYMVKVYYAGPMRKKSAGVRYILAPL